MLCRSWDSGFSEFGEAPPVPQISDAPETVQLKTPEGFAFYAVYPEAYIEAARRLRLSAPPRVIGIRSIGTTLGSVVAAALDAEPPGTVRPFGDPFARRVAVDAASSDACSMARHITSSSTKVPGFPAVPLEPSPTG